MFFAIQYHELGVLRKVQSCEYLTALKWLGLPVVSRRSRSQHFLFQTATLKHELAQLFIPYTACFHLHPSDVN